jgi:hypothetical protein
MSYQWSSVSGQSPKAENEPVSVAHSKLGQACVTRDYTHASRQLTSKLQNCSNLTCLSLRLSTISTPFSMLPCLIPARSPFVSSFGSLFSACHLFRFLIYIQSMICSSIFSDIMVSIVHIPVRPLHLPNRTFLCSLRSITLHPTASQRY